MSDYKKDEAIRRAIISHENYKSSWRKESGAFTVQMISPRGKRMTYSGYCFEVKKHMDKTVEKIRKILGATE